MRINPDLVRKLMIYVEDTVSTSKLITSADIASGFHFDFSKIEQ